MRPSRGGRADTVRRMSCGALSREQEGDAETAVVWEKSPLGFLRPRPIRHPRRHNLWARLQRQLCGWVPISGERGGSALVRGFTGPTAASPTQAIALFSAHGSGEYSNADL